MPWHTPTVSNPPVGESWRGHPQAAYGRRNQATSRYRAPFRGGGGPRYQVTTVAQPRRRRSRNRRRFWLFTFMVLIATLVGAITLQAVAAQPSGTAAEPARKPAAPPTKADPPPPTSDRMPPTRKESPPRDEGPARDEGPGGPPPATQPAPGAGKDTAGPRTAKADTPVAYKNCDQAYRAGVTPLHPGDPGYDARLDKDGNGIACDEKDKYR